MTPNSPTAEAESLPRSARKVNPHSSSQPLWQIEIVPAKGYPDRNAERLRGQMLELGLPNPTHLGTARGFLVQGSIDRAAALKLAQEVLSDCVVEQVLVRNAAEPEGPASAT
ncbi:MAG: hypothetical protein ACKO81_15625, partial [Planctomycetota bacterium]